MTPIRRRRRRRSRTRRRRQHTQRLVVGALLVSGVTLLANPFPTLLGRAEPWVVRLEMAGGEQFRRNLANWFVFGNGAPALGLLLSLAGLSGVLFLWRAAYLADRRRWDTKCPRCANPSLARRRRARRERLVERVGVPLRRYRCPACDWEGTRIDSSLASQ